VAEILALARQHDERLKEVRQDLVRAETKLGVERAWKWPIRAGCVALGAVGLATTQNDAVRDSVNAFVMDTFVNIRTTGAATLITLVVAGIVIFGGVMLVRRLIEGPTPERKARKLMEQFARADGVAAYVFSEKDTADEEAETVDALLGPTKKQMRQRRMTSSHRLLTASLTRLLNESAEADERSRLRQLN
jgi:hypothetical protein